MKKIFKGVVVPIFMAIVIGFIFGKCVFGSYKSKLYETLRSSKLYLIENGEYETIDIMKEENINNNYIYYRDNDKYKTVIGITKEYENIDKIKQIYDGETIVLEYFIPNGSVSMEQIEYDNFLKETDDIKEVREIVDNILELYRNNDNIKLISG
jgi:hypothetical protein